MNSINSNASSSSIKKMDINLGKVESYQIYEINQKQHILRIFSNGGLGLPVNTYHQSILEISFSSAKKVDKFVKEFLYNKAKKINALHEKPYANSNWTVRNAFNTPYIYRLDSKTKNLQIKVSPSKESPDNHMTTEFQNIEHRPVEFYERLFMKFPRLSAQYPQIPAFLQNLNPIPYQIDLETLANMEKQILIRPEEKPEYIAIRQCYGVAEPKSNERSRLRLKEEITALETSLKMQAFDEEPKSNKHSQLQLEETTTASKNPLKMQLVDAEPTIDEDIIEEHYERKEHMNNKSSLPRKKSSYTNLADFGSKKS